MSGHHLLMKGREKEHTEFQIYPLTFICCFPEFSSFVFEYFTGGFSIHCYNYATGQM